MKASDLLVSVERYLEAPPELVFRALTDPNLFSMWMGPEGSSVTVEEMEVAVGGRLAFSVSLPGDGPLIELYGYYEEIVPPDRLVHSWAMEGDEAVSTVVFDLEADGPGTRLHLSHHGLTTPEQVSQNDAGWKHQLDRMQKVIGATS